MSDSFRFRVFVAINLGRSGSVYHPLLEASSDAASGP